MRLTTPLLLATLTFTAATALADDAKTIDVNGNNRKVTETCAADTEVVINGNGHTVKLSGPCAQVTVNGTGHDVTIERTTTLDVNGTNQKVAVSTVATITVNGLKNKVSWERAIEGKKPAITSNGMGNAVVEMAKGK